MPDLCRTPACCFIVSSRPSCVRHQERRPLIGDDLQTRLWAHMSGIARTNGFKALEVGGMPDHAHLLISLPSIMPVAKAMQLIKAGSSLSMHETAGRPLFQWQEKYGAFSIGISRKEMTARYIRNQKKHHARVNFREEW